MSFNSQKTKLIPYSDVTIDTMEKSSNIKCLPKIPSIISIFRYHDHKFLSIQFNLSPTLQFKTNVYEDSLAKYQYIRLVDIKECLFNKDLDVEIDIYSLLKITFFKCSVQQLSQLLKSNLYQEKIHTSPSLSCILVSIEDAKKLFNLYNHVSNELQGRIFEMKNEGNYSKFQIHDCHVKLCDLSTLLDIRSIKNNDLHISSLSHQYESYKKYISLSDTKEIANQHLNSIAKNQSTNIYYSHIEFKKGINIITLPCIENPREGKIYLNLSHIKELLLSHININSIVQMCLLLNYKIKKIANILVSTQMNQSETMNEITKHFNSQTDQFITFRQAKKIYRRLNIMNHKRNIPIAQPLKFPLNHMVNNKVNNKFSSESLSSHKRGRASSPIIDNPQNFLFQKNKQAKMISKRYKVYESLCKSNKYISLNNLPTISSQKVIKNFQVQMQSEVLKRSHRNYQYHPKFNDRSINNIISAYTNQITNDEIHHKIVHLNCCPTLFKSKPLHLCFNSHIDIPLSIITNLTQCHVIECSALSTSKGKPDSVYLNLGPIHIKQTAKLYIHLYKTCHSTCVLCNTCLKFYTVCEFWNEHYTDHLDDGVKRFLKKIFTKVKSSFLFNFRYITFGEQSSPLHEDFQVFRHFISLRKSFGEPCFLFDSVNPKYSKHFINFPNAYHLSFSTLCMNDFAYYHTNGTIYNNCSFTPQNNILSRLTSTYLNSSATDTFCDNPGSFPHTNVYISSNHQLPHYLSHEIQIFIENNVQILMKSYNHPKYNFKHNQIITNEVTSMDSVVKKYHLILPQSFLPHNYYLMSSIHTPNSLNTKKVKQKWLNISEYL